VSGWRRTIGAYAELARISNLPTCATNVLTGCALAARGEPMHWPRAAALTAAIMLMYVAGMAFNDLCDLEVDQDERPGRPLPSGRVTVRGAERFVWVCMSLGWGIVAVLGLMSFAMASALVVTIVAYDLTHRRWAGSVVLMGTCRGLVYIVAASAITWPLVWREVGVAVGAITAYVGLLSVVARDEMATAPRGRWMAWTLPVVALAPLLVLRPTEWTWTLIAGAALLGWLTLAALRLRGPAPRVPAAVLGWLSGLCLLDAFYLTLLDQPTAAIVAGGCFLVTVLAHRRILGT
jgi:4-hydroxybenzoate polyprenyltransferase